MSQRWKTAVVVAAAGLALTACGSPGSPGAAAQEGDGGKAAEAYKVGLVYSKSGPLASYGEQYRQGFTAGLDHATRVLAAEEPALRVYALDPGDMRTQMHQDAFPGEDISDRPEPQTAVPGLVRLLDGSLPSGRYRAAELAPVAAPA